MLSLKRKKKKKKWEDGCFALCCVWQPPRTHGFGTSPLCSAGGCQSKGRKFSSPTSGLEISLFLGSIKWTSSALASLAFGEGLAGEGGYSCCYTQSQGIMEARLWANCCWGQLHGLGPGPSPSVLLGQEDAAHQPSGPCGCWKEVEGVEPQLPAQGYSRSFKGMGSS